MELPRNAGDCQAIVEKETDELDLIGLSDTHWMGEGHFNTVVQYGPYCTDNGNDVGWLH